MSEALGQIQKPSVEEFKGGKRLFFVPLIYCGKEAPAEYVEKFNEYWKQVEEQIRNLEMKLGKVQVILHEFVAAGGEEGVQGIKDLNEKSYKLAKKRIAQGAQVEALEDSELLAEMMDWSRCISVGLQSHKALASVYDSYVEVSKSRDCHLCE